MKIDPSDLNRAASHNFLTSIVSPRPIAFVSTASPDGVNNLAPFSFFAALCARPPILGFSCGRRRGEKKDTLLNIEAGRDFVVNVVSAELAEAMNQTSADYLRGVDEFHEARLTAVPSDLVKSPRVLESPVNMECRLMQILELGQAPDINSFIIGEVVRIHVADDMLRDGIVDAEKLKAIGRLGGSDIYCHTDHVFVMKRPRI